MDQTKNTEDTASFICQATGNPVPYISWYFSDVLISNETDVDKYNIAQSTLNTTTISSTLTIYSLESSDVGTYICNATNVISTITSSGVLTVNGKYVVAVVDLTCIKFNFNSCPKHYHTNGRTTV